MNSSVNKYHSKGRGLPGWKLPCLCFILLLSAVLNLLFIFCLPRKLFSDTAYSTVVEDRNGVLLGARIAEDGQWRFPERDSLPMKYEKALLRFEDKYFYIHPGVNPFSILRALSGNIKSGRVTSGGSTLTMQVIRILREGQPRTVKEKILEAFMALRLETRCSKKRILCLYASHAPFGGNVVGIDAASWRYFGTSPESLSWGEAATLAVLPNAPSYIHPGKNRGKLLDKRNALLTDLFEHHAMDSLTWAAAISEPLPDEPKALPQNAFHYVERLAKDSAGRTIRTSLDISIQQNVEHILSRHHAELSRIGIEDLCAVVLDVRTMTPLAYVGNVNPDEKRDGAQVDIITSPRSTGSILKPLLYCSLLQDGMILPYTLLPDVPVNINGFAPQNFDRTYSGAVSAEKALARSLNVPAVHMLREYTVPRFHELLKKAGMTTLTKEASHYGLALILGGAEGTLEDITRIYASLSGEYQDFGSVSEDFPLTDKISLYYTFSALGEVNRPDEIDPHLVPSIGKVAWKTGTSYGYRDAWAVGVTPEIAVGVWAGNASGRGVAGLTGARTAGPVLFDILSLFPRGEFFPRPDEAYGTYGEVCHDSGSLAGIHCEKVDTLLIPMEGLKSRPCTYHREIAGRKAFILPPSMEWYYVQGHPEYEGMPKEAVSESGEERMMEFIYPEMGSVMTIPRQLDGTVRGIVFNLAHRDPGATVFWHLDDTYIGQTKFMHQMSLIPSEGKHTVTVVDDKGRSYSLGFEIL